MAKRVVKTETTEELEPQVIDNQAPDEWQDTLDSIGAHSKKISVSRLDRNGKFSYVGTLPPGADILDRIQESYGGGEYTLRFHDESGRIADNRTGIMIADRNQAASSPAAPASANGHGELAMMRDQMNRQQELLIHLIDKQNGAGADSKGNDLVKIIQAVAALRELGGDPQAHVSSAVNALLEGVKLGAKNTGGAGGGEDKITNILRIVDRVGEVLPRVIGPVSAAFAPRPPAFGPPPGAAPDVQGATGGREINPVENARALELLRQAIGYLKTKISKDPGLYAEWIASNLEESQWYLVARLLQEPYDTIVERIGDPDLAREPYRAWFSELIAELKQNAGNVDSGRPPGNGGDTPGNGEPDPAIGEG